MGAINPPSKIGRSRKHRQHHAVQQTHQDRSHHVQERRHQEQRQVKRRQVIHRKVQRVGVHHRGQQVNRIPDAAVRQQAEGAGQHGHRDASGQSAFNTRRHRINFDRNAQPLHFRSGAGDLRPRRDDLHFFRFDRRRFVMLMRQHIAEPADRSHQHQNAAHHGDVGAGQQSGEQQRGAERQNNRPRRRRRKLDCFLILFHIHRPIM